MSEVCGNWRCEAFKLPHFHSLDHALIRGKTVFAIAEVKVRSSSKRVMVSLDKVLRARQIGRAAGRFLIVRTDGLGSISKLRCRSRSRAGQIVALGNQPRRPVRYRQFYFHPEGRRWNQSGRKAQILLVPRNDGFLVVIDGKETMKPMSAKRCSRLLIGA